MGYMHISVATVSCSQIGSTRHEHQNFPLEHRKANQLCSVPPSAAAAPAMNLKTFVPTGEKPPDAFDQGHHTSGYQHITASPVYLLQLLHKEDLPIMGSKPSSITYPFIVILAGNNGTTTTFPTYKGTLHHRITVIIWNDTGHPPSIIGDKIMLWALKPCLPAHVNQPTNSATTSSIVHMFLVIIWIIGLPSPAAIPLAETNATEAAAAIAAVDVPPLPSNILPCR
jgi:hypothetical protein